jgi:HEAT repeat protein
MERARERAASIAILTSIPMVAQLIAGRAVRDALFLTEYDAVYLPRVMLAAAALSLGAAMSVSRLMPRWGPRGTALALAVVNGAIFVFEAALIDVAPRSIAVITYIHVSVVGALVVSAFSSVVNERFDPLHAKTVVAQVGTGGALGGVLGGVLALFLSDYFELATILYGLGGASVLIAVGVWNIGKSTQAKRSSDEKTKFGIQTMREDAYLRRVALTVVLLGAVSALVDYAMKAEADARFADSAGLLSFFAAFYMATSLLTFVMQAGVARPLLEKIGLGGTMAVLPLAVALSAGFGAAWTRLWTATLTRGTQTIVSNSLFRSGYELLYTPVPPLKKRATKALIDIACNRIGHGVGSVIIMGIVAVAATADIATSSVLVMATIVALISAWMVRQLHDGYVNELATSLREGAIVLQSDDIVDATTLHTLAAVMNRQQLLDSIEELERERSPAQSAALRETWIAQLSDLLSEDPQRVLGVLLDESLSPRLAAHVIDLLGNDLYARPAYHALERMSPQVTGQLVDAMLSNDSPAAVRRRVPRLLRKIEDPRAVRGLLEGLRDQEFDVRYRCGHALAHLQRGDRDAHEVAADQEQWQDRRLSEELAPDVQGEIDALLEAREDRNLQHVFTLLSLALDRDAIVLSLRALSSQDANLRGTALEYLHNVLPERVREPLWPRLTERSERPRVRSTESSPEDLLQSMQSLMLDRDQLGK